MEWLGSRFFFEVVHETFIILLLYLSSTAHHHHYLPFPKINWRSWGWAIYNYICITKKTIWNNKFNIACARSDHDTCKRTSSTHPRSRNNEEKVKSQQTKIHSSMIHPSIQWSPPLLFVGNPFPYYIYIHHKPQTTKKSALIYTPNNYYFHWSTQPTHKQRKCKSALEFCGNPNNL
jgi:hypothetical protein